MSATQFIASLTVLLVLGCDRRVPMPSVAPFSELDNVELGMTAGELQEMREVRVAAYVGFVEERSHGRWSYELD